MTAESPKECLHLELKRQSQVLTPALRYRCVECNRMFAVELKPYVIGVNIRPEEPPAPTLQELSDPANSEIYSPESEEDKPTVEAAGGSSPLPTKEMLYKLPQWARFYIEKLERASSKIPEKAEPAAQPSSPPAKKSILDGVHQWVGQRAGGDPADASSSEWVKYCSACGMEYNDDVPPCPGDLAATDDSLPSVEEIAKVIYENAFDCRWEETDGIERALWLQDASAVLDYLRKGRK